MDYSFASFAYKSVALGQLLAGSGPYACTLRFHSDEGSFNVKSGASSRCFCAVSSYGTEHRIVCHAQ